MKPIRCVFLLVLIALSALVDVSVMGQVGTEGAILGVVKDTTGAVIPGAEVTVTNLETGLKKTMLTDDSGSFEILALPRGPYSLNVTLSGFKTWTLARTELTVGERKRISPVLEVGEVAEQITVEGREELIQTEVATVQSIVEQKQIRELPLNGRNPVELVALVPGMRFVSKGGPERASVVQGLGNREDQTEFQLDGLNANAGMDEAGIAIPNVDTVAEFNVETSNFSAEHGRNPLQIIVVTKSGTNDFHGTAWEFHRNDRLDARNAFAPPGARKPKLIRNQFGFTLGGPIVKDKTHFFGSFEGTTIRQEIIYNSFTVAPAMLQGDFSSLTKKIIDPQTGEAFRNNKIPESRFSNASKFFLSHVLLPNSAGQRFRAVAPLPNDTYEYTSRIDHQISDKQRIYGRWVVADNEIVSRGYKPEVDSPNATLQHNIGLNYNYSITPTTLFSLSAGYIRSLNKFTSNVVGTENLTQNAGIQGFVTEGRANAVGLPNVSFTGYRGFEAPWGVPGRLWFESYGGKASGNLIRSEHTINFGYEFNDRSTYGNHASCCTRGVFGFNGQYTGDGFADFLLGLIASSSRNFPIQSFGMSDSPYSAFYVQDFWRAHPNVTLNLGLRLDYWHEKAHIRGNASTFDVKLGKAVAAMDCKTGQVDLNAQPVAKFLAKASQGFWVPASEAGAPCGLHKANTAVSPRLGVAWRPMGSSDLVLRAGYGIFASSYRGNATASAIIGPPYWTFETQGWSAAQLQRWEKAWPADPTAFVTPSVQAPDWRVEEMKAHEWNISLQKSLPFDSAVTLSYVGNNIVDMITNMPRNDVPPGQYPNLQAAKPFPFFGSLLIYENIGESWYNSLQFKWERRFTRGLSYQASYAFGKHIGEAENSIWDTPTPFAPAGYNRGRSELDRTHILTVNSVWEIPFGRGRTFGSDIHPVANVILGGWQVAGLHRFISGAPLSFGVPGATLGNGWGTRPNQVGDPELDNASADLWFNPAAFQAPPRLQFGNSGIGILDGPGFHSLDIGLMKNFFFEEDRYLQFRWEMFNAPNHVNLSNPTTTIGLSQTGKIFSAAAARQMQMGLKFVF